MSLPMRTKGRKRIGNAEGRYRSEMENAFWPLAELWISSGIRSKKQFELWCVSRSEGNRRMGFSGSLFLFLPIAHPISPPHLGPTPI
jgi:hypothetical protein